MKLKICGIRDPVNIREVSELSPDYMGFIFYPKSPRFVGENFELPKDFPSSISRVGVFVNESGAAMIRIARLYNLQYLQLHGNENVEICKELKSAGLGVIKVFSIGDEFDFSILRPYKGIVDYFMFDTKGLLYGGNAKAFDWKILNGYDQEIPFFLSGGISEKNIDNITSLKDMNIYAIDVNSGVESSPGIKDCLKVIQLRKQLSRIKNI